MANIQGSIQISTGHKKTQKRITTSSIKIGEVRLSNDKMGYTTFSTWVPLPTQADHIPGIMIALSNPSGRCFSRLSTLEVDKLTQFLLDASGPLTTALATAQSISSELHILDKQLSLRYPDLSHVFSTQEVH